MDLKYLDASLDSPDDLPIVVILDLLLMARVHRISRLIGLEESRLLLDGVGLHHDVMLHKLRLVPGLMCRDILLHIFFKTSSTWNKQKK